MPTRRKQSSRPPADPSTGADEDRDDDGTAEDDDADDADDTGASDDAEGRSAPEEEPSDEIEDEASGEAADLDDDDSEDSDDDGDQDEEEEEEDDDGDGDGEVVIAAPARPAGRPSPGRPPSAKEEPEPPFFIGERVRLVKNTRPRTGSPIADHPVGATGRVETVLSQTAIVRFDRAPDTKEVVAFTCLESLDEEAMARRAERDRQAARG